MKPIPRGPFTYNPDISGQVVHPSTLPYAAGGQSVLSRKEFMPPEVQRAMSAGTALDSFWNRSDVGLIIRTSPVVQQALARYGYTGMSLQQKLAGQVGGLSMRGTIDVGFTTGGQLRHIVDDKVTNQPIGIVDDMLVSGDRPYGLQAQAYAAMSGAQTVSITTVPRATAAQIEDSFDGLQSQEQEVFIARLIEAHIIGGNSINTTSSSPQLSAALEVLTNISTRTQNVQPQQMQPGGTTYDVGRQVALEQAAIQELTGVSFERLRYQDIPNQFSAQYNVMYTTLGQLGQKVARGEIRVSFAKAEAERVRGQLGLPWDTNLIQGKFETVKAPGIDVSQTFGTTSTRWGTAIGPNDDRYAILGAPIRVSGGTFTTPMTTYASEKGRMPSALTGEYGELLGRPIINGRLAIRYQNPEDLSVTEQQILASAVQMFEQAGGGEAGARRVEDFLQKVTEGNPIISKNIMTTSTSAARNLLRLAVNITDVVGMQIPDPRSGEPRHTRPLTHGDWYRMSKDLVIHGADASTAHPLPQVISGVPGWTGTPSGMMRTAITADEAEKLDKRMQQSLRREGMLTAPGRNVASIVRMEGAPSVEFGILIRNAAVGGITAEGQGYFDAQTIREIGKFKIAQTLSYEIKSGDDFKPAEGKFQVLKDPGRPGEYRVIIGKNHGIDVAVPIKDYDGFYADAQGASFRQVGGRTFFEVDGIGEIDPNSQTVKSWLGNKAMMAGYEGLRRDVRANRALKGNVEAMFPQPKNTRQMAYMAFAGEFGPIEGASASENQRRLNKFVRELKTLGIDAEGQGFLAKPNEEEIKGFAMRNINAPSHIVIWNYKLDEAMLKIAQKKSQQAIRRGQTATFTTPMSFEEAYMWNQALGPGGVNVEDWDQWESQRHTVREVTVNKPLAIMPLMVQIGREYTGRAAISLEEMADQIGEAKRLHGDQKMREVYNYVVNDFLPMAAKASGHTRDYYQGLLKSQLASKGVTQPETANVIEWAAVRDLIGQSGSIHTAMRQNSTLTNQMIRLPNGQYLPSLGDLRIMSVDSPLRQAMLTPEGYEEENAPFPVDEHNSIVRMIGEMATHDASSNQFGFLSDRVTSLLEKLTSTKAVEKGLYQFNLTGGGGVESPYVAYTGLRPWEKVVGSRNLMKLFGTEDLDAISGMINSGQNMVFGQRRPNVLPFLSGLVPSMLRKHTDWRGMRKTKFRQIPEEFSGTAMSPTSMDVHIGDFDGDRMAIFLAATQQITQTAVAAGIGERDAEQLFLSRMKSTLEMVTGQEITGELTWRGYVDRVVSLKDVTGNKLSEIANWIRDADRGTPTVERLTQKFMAEMTTKEGRQGMLARTLYKAQIGPVMNRFTRNMASMMEQQGLTDEYRSVVGRFDQRLRLFSYQKAIDAPISGGLRKLLAISKWYTVRQSVEGGNEKLWGEIMDDLAPTMEKQGFERIDFDKLPAEIVKAVLESSELRGLGDPDKPVVNQRWAQDVGLLLSRDKDLAAKIAEMVKPLQGMNTKEVSVVVDTVAGKIMNELVGNAKSFWQQAGPLPASLAGHVTARARKSQRTQWFGRYSEMGEDLQPISGIGLIAEQQEKMLASQRLPSGTSSETEFEYRKKSGLMGLLHDMAYAQVPAVLARALGIPGATTMEAIKRLVPRFTPGDVPDTRFGMFTEKQARTLKRADEIKSHYSHMSEEEAMAAALAEEGQMTVDDEQVQEVLGRVQSALGVVPSTGGMSPQEIGREPSRQRLLNIGRGRGREDAVPVYLTGGKPKTVDTVFGTQWEDVLRDVQKLGGAPTRSWISQQHRMGRITGTGVRSLLPLTRGQGGYGAAETVIGKLRDMSHVTAARLYERTATLAGVMPDTLGERFGALYESAGQQFGEEDLSRALGDFSIGLLGDEGLKSIGRRGGVKGIGAMGAEIKRMRSGGASSDVIRETVQELVASSNVSATHLAEQRIEKFAGHLEKVNLHLEHYDDLLKRVSDPAKYAKETGPQQRQIDRGLAGELAGIYKAVSGPGAEHAAKLMAEQMGIEPEAVARLAAAGGGAGGEAISGALAGAGGGRGMRHIANKLFEGDLGQLGWGLFNLQRAWRYTGGVVTGEMGTYAKYAAGQQQAISAMGEGGTEGYFGPVSNVVRGQAAIARTGLMVGKAGWDQWGGMTSLLGTGGSPEEPGWATYLGVTALPLAGALIVKGLAKNLLGKLNVPQVIEEGIATSGMGQAGVSFAKGAYGALGKAATVAFAATAGLEIGKTIGWALAPGKQPGETPEQTFQMQMRNVTTGQRNLTMLGAIEARYGKESPEYREAALAMLKSEQGFRQEIGLGEADERTRRYREYVKLGERVEQQVGLMPGGGLQAAAAVAKATGMTAGQLGTGAGYQALTAMAGITDEATRNERLQLAQNIGISAGVKFGGNFAPFMTQAAGMSDAQVLQVSEALSRVQPYTNWARSAGVPVPWAAQAGNLPISTQWQFANFQQPEVRAQMLQQGIPALGAVANAGNAIAGRLGLPAVTTQAQLYAAQNVLAAAMPVEPETGLPFGTTPQYAAQRGLRPELLAKTIAQTGWTPGLYGMTNLQMQLPDIQSLQTRQNVLQQQTFQRSQGYQLQDLQMGLTQAFGGTLPTGADIKGSFYWQAAGAGESIRNIKEMAKLQAGTMNYGWLGGGLAGVADKSITELGQAGLGYRQFYENLDLQRKQSGLSRGWRAEDAQIQWQRGTTQLGWQEQDLTTNFARTMKQFTYQMQDLSTNFQRGQTQFGWQREDIAFQGNQQALQFGWGMQDIEEQMRFSTGRQRRQLSRQRERATVQYGMGVEQLERQESRLGIREQWAEEDFGKEKSRLEERRKWAEADYDKEKDRIDVRRDWLDEDLARALARLGLEAGLEEEGFALKVKQFEEDQKMQKLLHDESVKHALAMAGISAGQAAEAKKVAEAEFAIKMSRLAQSLSSEGEMFKISGQLLVATTFASAASAGLARDWGPGGLVSNAFTILNQTVYDGLLDQNNTGSTTWMMDKFVDVMKMKISELLMFAVGIHS